MNRVSILLISIPLILSAFTHLFNPIGFPCVQPDEGVYVRRAMHLLQGLGPQDPASRFDHGQGSISSYDHPYFGQLFLAGALGAIGYPNSLNPSSSVNVLHSIEMLYLVPRVLMGVLAVVDTFLVYKISERRYNRNVAVIASVLFAVMPLSWLIRRIYLDTILMPFLLSSILFALYTKGYSKNDDSWSKSKKNITLILLSGTFLGLAIFTKIPAFTVIPLVGFIIFTNNNRNLKSIGLWFIPVILIPSIWPMYALYNGQFYEWFNGVLWQSTGRHGIGIRSIYFVFEADPALLILGVVSAISVAIRKDFFFLMWLIPFFIYTLLIGWVTFFHWMLLLPVLCIASARLIENISNTISKKRIQRLLLLFAMIFGIGIFGLVSTIMLITTNSFLAQFEAAAFVAQNTNKNNSNNDVTIVSGPIYSWLFKYVFGDDHVFSHYRDSSQPIQTKKIILIVDSTYRYTISNVLSKNEVEDKTQIERLQKIYNSTSTIATFVDSYVPFDYHSYPYVNIKDCLFFNIEVKANY